MLILSDTYFEVYSEKLPTFQDDQEYFLSSSSTLDFDYMTDVSSLYSANIEGNSLDLNSFMNGKNTIHKPKEREEIEDLIRAYNFAQKNPLTEANFLHTHRLSSRILLIESLRGQYRNDKVGVFGSRGLIYLAIEAEHVGDRMHELFHDIGILLESELSPKEIFYYASYMHLVFVHIHPFADGNGRSARLLEKWFIASKLGSEYWKLSSEKYYKENRTEYYKNIDLGVNYYELDYSLCQSFLGMLPKSLTI